MKKSLLQMITLALVVMNLVLTVILVFTCMPAISKTGNLVNRICEIVDLDLAGASGNSNTVDIANLEEIAVTFNGESTQMFTLNPDVEGGKSHWLQIGVTLVVDKSHTDYKAKRANIDSAMGRINDIIRRVITQYTVSEVQNNTEEIRKEILGELRQLFDSTFIYDVSFPNFVIQ